MKHPNQGQSLFSAAEVYQLRREWAARTISVKDWADEKNCSHETIRRIGRGETYRNFTETPEEARVVYRQAAPAAEPSPGELVASMERLREELAQQPTVDKTNALIAELMGRGTR